jgi:hypothetical protein
MPCVGEARATFLAVPSDIWNHDHLTVGMLIRCPEEWIRLVSSWITRVSTCPESMSVNFEFLSQRGCTVGKHCDGQHYILGGRPEKVRDTMRPSSKQRGCAHDRANLSRPFPVSSPNG